LRGLRSFAHSRLISFSFAESRLFWADRIKIAKKQDVATSCFKAFEES